MRLYSRKQLSWWAWERGARTHPRLRRGIWEGSLPGASQNSRLGDLASSVRANRRRPRSKSTLPPPRWVWRAPATSMNEYSPDEKQNIDVYERLNEGVVNITTEQLYYNWFSEAVPQEGDSGSGSIIDPQGYVLTNKHVVKDAYKVYVGLADGSRYEAKVIGIDPENDLAVIKFTPPKGIKLTVIPFGDSPAFESARKCSRSATPSASSGPSLAASSPGIGRPVSQTERDANGISRTVVIQNMIQTDASINPGNSGGPLSIRTASSSA